MQSNADHKYVNERLAFTHHIPKRFSGVRLIPLILPEFGLIAYRAVPFVGTNSRDVSTPSRFNSIIFFPIPPA